MPTLRSAGGCNLNLDYKAVSSVVNSTLAFHAMALGDASSWLSVYGVVRRHAQEGSMPHSVAHKLSCASTCALNPLFPGRSQILLCGV